MKKHALHFKLRVIDLLETFSQSQPQSLLILYTIENMLGLLLQHSNEKEVKARLTSALKKILSRKECPSSPEIDILKTESMLKSAHQLSGRINDSSFSNLCSLASVFLVKVLSSITPNASLAAKKQKTDQKNATHVQSESLDDVPVISQIYFESFNNFITKSKSKLKPSLFLELFNRYPQYGWNIIIKMVDVLSGEKIKAYNLVQGYNILVALIKQNKDVIFYFTLIIYRLAALVKLLIPLLQKYLKI